MIKQVIGAIFIITASLSSLVLDYLEAPQLSLPLTCSFYTLGLLLFTADWTPNHYASLSLFKHNVRSFYHSIIVPLLLDTIKIFAFLLVFSACGYFLLQTFPDKFIFYANSNVSHALAFNSLTSAKKGGEYDVTIIGDSSVGSGVDTGLLQKLTGLRVLNLHSTGFASPLSYAIYLDRFFKAGGKTECILFIQHPTVLELGNNSQSYITLYENIENPPKFPSIHGFLNKYRAATQSVLPKPMEGKWGAHYGSCYNFNIHNSLSEQGWIDPTNGLTETLTKTQIDDILNTIKEDTPTQKHERSVIELSLFYQSSLHEMSLTINKYFNGLLLFSFSPITSKDFHYGSPSIYEDQLKQLNKIINYSPNEYIDIPFSFPTVYKSTETHSNIIGKTIFTHILASKLNTIFGRQQR